MKLFTSPRRAIIRAGQQICYGRYMPLPSSGCPDAAFVERLGNGHHTDGAGRLNAPDNGQEIGRELLGRGDLYSTAECVCVHDVSRIAQLSALRLLGGKAIFGSFGNPASGQGCGSRTNVDRSAYQSDHASPQKPKASRASLCRGNAPLDASKKFGTVISGKLDIRGRGAEDTLWYGFFEKLLG